MEDTQKIIEKYLQLFPQDKLDLSLLLKQTGKNERLFNRKNFTGHIVANSLIIHNNKALTIFHNFLKIYIQPGGHIEENDLSVLQAASREAKEETGISDLVLCDWHKKTQIPIFIESHLIPENIQKQEKKHYHHDFMYIFKTNTKDINLQPNEVSDFSWIDIRTVLEKDPDSFISKSLKRMFELKII